MFIFATAVIYSRTKYETQVICASTSTVKPQGLTRALSRAQCEKNQSKWIKKRWVKPGSRQQR